MNPTRFKWFKLLAIIMLVADMVATTISAADDISGIDKKGGNGDTPKSEGTVSITQPGGEIPEAYRWRSKDGRVIAGRGLFCGTKGITVQRLSNREKLFLPYSALDVQDAKRGLQDLPFATNDDVVLSAHSSKMAGEKVREGTGEYVTTLTLYSYDGYHIKGVATTTELTEIVRYSNRTVEASLSSLSGDGECAVEFFVVNGEGREKKIVNHQKGIFEFKKLGSTIVFESPPAVENYNGWVVLARSLNTGEVIATSSSLQFLIKYVLDQIPERAEFKNNSKQFKDEILKTLGQ
jgi:hypothetical protein